MKKANAIAEYSVLIFIVVAAIMGLNYELKRRFQAFIKVEADEHIRMPVPILWQSSVKFTNQKVSQDRFEAVGGDTLVVSDMQNPYTVLSAPPPPMGAPVAGLHAQDAASTPPTPNDPSHDRKDNQTTIQTENGGC